VPAAPATVRPAFRHPLETMSAMAVRRLVSRTAMGYLFTRRFPLPDDPMIHQYMLACASDFSLVLTIAE
jgi:acyl-CoA thioesterase